MSLRCRLFGHRFPEVKLTDGHIFHRVDCERPKCDYAMDAVAFKRIIESLPEGRLRDHAARQGPRFV